MTTEIDTPITNRFTKPFAVWNLSCTSTAMLELTLASTARQLETELIAAQAEIALLKKVKEMDDATMKLVADEIRECRELLAVVADGPDSVHAQYTP